MSCLWWGVYNLQDQILKVNKEDTSMIRNVNFLNIYNWNYKLEENLNSLY